MTKRYYIETFGCQMNVNDSEKVAGLLRASGYEEAASPEQAEAVFINTCAVREKAADKLFHSVGRLRRQQRDRPELKIGVGGCVPQLIGADSVMARAPGLDLVVGPHNVGNVAALFERAREGEKGLVDLDRKADRFSVPDELVAHTNPVRAYVTAMEGCNHVCSFCVVPRTRGPEVCRPLAEIVGEVAKLVARGVPEVMLLGQTVNAYRHAGADFADLLAAVHSVPGLKRLRFTTSHPEHVDLRVAEAMGSLERLCPYLHLPVQSGSDRILASMRRGYTVAEYRQKVALLREHVPNLAISSDFICGYPSESEAEFEASLALVEEIGFAGLFVFAYSPRPGTTALRLEDDVPEREKRRRVQVLNDFQQRQQRRRNEARVGAIEDVLAEALGEDGKLSGRTADFRSVHFEGASEWIGRCIPVEIVEAGANSLIGRPVPG